MLQKISRRTIIQSGTAMGLAASWPFSVRADIDGIPRSDYGFATTADEVVASLDLSGRTMLITGCNSGLGYESMRSLAARGAHIIGTARTQEKAEKACASVAGKTTPLVCELTDFDTIVACSEQVQALDVPIVITEQYPKGLGPTVPELANRLENIRAKVTFSCGSCHTLWSEIEQQQIHRLLVVGIEAHVCIQQTVFDLLTAGMRVYLAVDAIGSRHDIDYQTALRRMDSAGATLTTTEAALFEWCERSDIPEFKTVSQLIQQAPPEG